MMPLKNNLPVIALGVFVGVCVLIGGYFFFFGTKSSANKPLSLATSTSVTTAPAVPPVKLVPMITKDSILRSQDGGGTFTTYFRIATSGPVGLADVLAISFHPLVHDQVVVTTSNDGIFFNANRENVWTPVNFPPKQIYSFILDKKSPDNKVLASGVVGNNGRIFRTTNAGVDWRVVYAEPGPGTHVSGLAQHPKDLNVMLAGTSGGTVVKSLDSGDTWKNVGQKISGVISQFAFDATKTSFVYLLAYQKKIYHSPSGGTEWLDWEVEKAKEVSDMKKKAADLTAKGDKGSAKILLDQATALSKRNTENKAPGGIVLIVADPTKSGTIYAGTSKGLYRSPDFGKYWYKLNIIESAERFPIRSLAVNPKNSKEVSFVAGKSFYKSTNSGETWATVPLDNARNASFVAYDPFDPSVIFVGMSSK